jgi:2-amino-4-hydroxy-6-hydroxymethyldihydropteridine diphosphokinase
VLKSDHSFQKALIALGSNEKSVWGDAKETLQQACRQLESAHCKVRGKSRFYATPAFPRGSGPDFVNAAVVVETAMSADALLAVLHEIERGAVRIREKRWGPRTLDMDLIGFENQVLPDHNTFAHWRDLTVEYQMRIAPHDLILPHPRMQDRAFVLVPLMDIAPDWVHPVSGLCVRDMLAALPPHDIAAITLIVED